ncbi:MAG: Stp1/IreP family PP2C-type Ser/Thr phosphatase [Bacillota bacterium]|nr:Stp1/IreP family PP2C-type Ser/Thr phosphatase [Bacillota bacterium]
MNAISFSVNGLTDCGLNRKNNEDNYLIEEGKGAHNANQLLCAVADGMGGKEYGELASALATEALRKEFRLMVRKPAAGLDITKWLQDTVQKANLKLLEQASRIKARDAIGSTLVTVLITDQKAFIANVGDSRAYLLRNNELYQITRDHSLVSIMVEKEIIKPEEIYTYPRRGELMRYLGQERDVKADIFELELIGGDTLLLCSDGLWAMVKDQEMRSILTMSLNPKDACKKLVEAANRAGGEDNITVIIVRIQQREKQLSVKNLLSNFIGKKEK